MTVEQQELLLADHADMRVVPLSAEEIPADRNRIVQLSPDHPGFRDPEYRGRRNRIAQLALSYQSGQPIPEAPYSTEEHQVWHAVWQACAEYLACVRQLAFPPDRIPQLREVNEKVQAISGFRLEPVAGLVEPRVFLESLASGTFLCTQYIRHHSTPLYTPEPDVVHEIVGHAVTLASKRLSELNRLFGKAVKRTSSLEALNRLSRVYWFTIEFGVLRENGALKAYGTGLLSSAGELEAMHNAELRPLDFEEASRHEYDPTHYQPVLFCAGSFETLYDSLRQFLVAW